MKGELIELSLSWCHNDILILGEKSALDILEESLFDFKTLRPVPGQFLSDKSQQWYKWCVENWGTKWNAVDVETRRRDSKTLRVTFKTAFNPPGKLFRYLCDMYRIDIAGSYKLEGWPMKKEWFEYEVLHDAAIPNAIAHLKKSLLKISHRHHKHKACCPSCQSDQFGFHKIKRSDTTLTTQFFETWICKNCNYQPFLELPDLV